MKGQVKWFNDKKGYGFITLVSGGDVFCHFSSIVSTDSRKRLKEGDLVEFEVEDGPKGRQATNVRKA